MSWYNNQSLREHLARDATMTPHPGLAKPNECVPAPGDQVCGDKGVPVALIKWLTGEVRETKTDNKAYRCTLEPFEGVTTRRIGWVIAGHLKYPDTATSKNIISGVWFLVMLDAGGVPTPVAVM